MKYRHHRGLLAESLATVVELADRAALVQHLQQTYGAMEPVRDDLIEVQWYAYDSRIDWQTYIVLLNGSPVGFTDGPA